ncbi:unnamed protein product [Orchesella dallaii]|uniref:Uncharacterized protein n=1 Tax=Orchesella dallaii TaxID=48710 RepID=A0ABP1S4H5_9HEXA
MAPTRFTPTHFLLGWQTENTCELSIFKESIMSENLNKEDSRNQNEIPVEKLTQKIKLEFHGLNSDIANIQKEYCNYKIRADDQLSMLHAKNTRLQSEVQKSATVVHTIYKEMSEVLVQNRIIAENNHILIAQKEKLENKIVQLKQSESRSQALFSIKCAEFSKDKEILLGELSSIKTSNNKLLLEFNSKIENLRENVLMERKQNENLQLKFTKLLTQKYKLELYLRKQRIVARKFGNLKTGKFNDGVAETTKKLGNGNGNILRLKQDKCKLRGNDGSVNSDKFQIMKPFCTSSSTTRASAKGTISGGNGQIEVVTLSDSEA